MPRWWHLATRNWRTRWGRTLACVLSVALGVGTVLAITALYETTRRMIRDEFVINWLGASHLSVEPPGAHHGAMEASVADEMADWPNIEHVTTRLHKRMFLAYTQYKDQLTESGRWLIDAIGINPDTELYFRQWPGLEGRMFTPDERGVAVIEKNVAAEWYVGIGDTVEIQYSRRMKRHEFKIVGLFDSQRLAAFQKPVVYIPIADAQELARLPGGATAVDIMLADPAPAKLQAMETKLKDWLKAKGKAYDVQSAKNRLEILEFSENVTRTALVLMACISMLTAFFIILTTMSMSLHERRTTLGIMRCVGVTRWQLVSLLLVEMLPVGLLGTALGLVGGWGVTQIVAHQHPGGPLMVYYSLWGAGLATASGLTTVILCVVFLAYQISGVSPLQALRTESRPARMRLVVMSAVAGVLSLVIFEYLRYSLPATAWLRDSFMLLSAFLTYAGYILLAPAAVVLLGGPIARVTGRLMRIDGQLAADQFVRSPWRSAAVCWMLLVGVSLIIYIASGVEYVYSIWQFPAQLPDAFVWTAEHVDGNCMERVREIQGLERLTVVTDVDCKIAPANGPKRSIGRRLLDQFLSKVTRPVFVAGEPDRLPELMKLDFVEGSLDAALPKLKRGGYVLVPTQTAHNQDIHLGDQVRVTINGVSSVFKVAGVIQAPALDIAVTFFQAESYFSYAAANVVFGTRKDMIERFGYDKIAMFLCELEIPEAPFPPSLREGPLPNHEVRRNVAEAMLALSDDLPLQRARIEKVRPEIAQWLSGEGELSQEAEAELHLFGRTLQWISYPWNRQHAPNLDARKKLWSRFRERLLLERVATEMGAGKAVMGSLTRLTKRLDRNLRRATAVLTWMPTLSLIVAGIGIGNLMMVSVRARARQLAMLRAVGAQRSQIMRLVLTEALVLGVLGCLLGFMLGVHTSLADNYIIGKLSGFRKPLLIPPLTTGLAFAITLVVAVVAAWGPARRAARSNVVEALQAV